MSNVGIRFLRLSLLQLLGAITLTAILLFGAIFLKNNTIANPYTSWGVGQLVSDYMRTHNNQWPDSWDQLQFHYDGNKQSYMAIESIDVIKKQFDIDFAIDAQKYLADHRLLQTFSPVSYRVSFPSYVGGREANDIIRDYIRSVP